MRPTYNPHDLIFIQSRSEINPAIITEYAGLMAEGVAFDPLEGVRDEQGRIYIWDGQHRGEAAKKAGVTLAVNLQSGDRSQAEWLALTANQKHGLRRTTADKQRVVRLALQHPTGAALSDREIARHCGVDHKTVGKLRQEMQLSGEIPQIETRQVTRNGTTYTQNTVNIGQEQPWLKSPRPVSGEIPQIAAQTTRNGTARTQQPEPRTQNSEPKTLNSINSTNSLNSTNPNCPRCGQDRIAGVNGSRRWCLNCNAEWPTAAHFLDEARRQPEDCHPLPLREQLLVRFASLLDKTPSKLGTVSDWLVDLENELQADRRPSYNDNHDPHRRLLAATTKRAVDDLKSPEAAKRVLAVEFLATEDGQFLLQKYGGLSARHAQEFLAQKNPLDLTFSR